MLTLEEFAFAQKLSLEELAYLKTHAKKVSIPKESILFYQDDICKDILLLGQGEIELYMYGENDKKIPLYALKAGEQCVINTSSTISQTPAIGTAQSLSDIEGWLISEKVVKHLKTQGEPEYIEDVTVDQEEEDGLRTLIGYRWTPRRYVRLRPDSQGRLLLKQFGIRIGLVNNRVVCYDAATDEPIGDYTQITHALEAETAARQAEAAARQAAEARVRDR